MDIRTRLTRCCGKDMGSGLTCHDGMRCPDCFDKLEGWREIERLRDALQFYSNPEHYEYKRGDMNVMSNVKWNEIVLDQGQIARSALQQKESE